MVFVTRWANEGMTGLGADLVKDRQSGGLQVPGASARRRAASGSTSVGRSSSVHRSYGAPPPPPLTTSNIATDYAPEPRFRKGAALAPDTTRIDAGSGEGPYNPSNPMDRLRAQVSQAAYNMWRRSNPTSSTPPSDITPSVAPIIAPQTFQPSGGGGGGGGDTSSDQPDASPGFWAGLSTPAKVGIIAAGLAVVGGGIYFFTRKRGGGAAPSHKS